MSTDAVHEIESTQQTQRMIESESADVEILSVTSVALSDMVASTMTYVVDEHQQMEIPCDVLAEWDGNVHNLKWYFNDQEIEIDDDNDYFKVIDNNDRTFICSC